MTDTAPAVRSFVRPVSPLSTSRPRHRADDDDELLHHASTRSRSPLVASTVVQMPPTRVEGSRERERDETRRVVIKRSANRIVSSNLDCFNNDDNDVGGGDRRHTGQDDERRRPDAVSHKLASRIDRRPPKAQPSGASKIDRENTCPILIRLSFTTNGRHSCITEFDNGKFPENELHINTWYVCMSAFLTLSFCVHTSATRNTTFL